MKRTVLTALVLSLLLLPVCPAQANSLRSDVLYLLPRETGEVGFIDVQELRGSPHFDRLKQRFLPPRFAHFERFIQSVGVDPEKDIEWVAWALLPAGPDNPSELFLGIAQGQFSPEAIQKYFEQQKLPTGELNGQTLFPFGRAQSDQSLQFTFLDSSTAVFGTRAALQVLLDTWLGQHETIVENDWLLEKIDEVNGRESIWVVLDETYTRLAMRQLLPELAHFEQFGQAADRFRGSSLALSVDREVALTMQSWFAESNDAQMFTLLLQTGLAAQSWELQEKNPTLSAALQRASVRSAGDWVEVKLAVEEKDMTALLEKRQLLP